MRPSCAVRRRSQGRFSQSGATVLRHTPCLLALVSPGDPVTLVIEHHGISVYADDGQYLGQVETRLGHRLSRLIEGGNTYAAAILGVNGEGISVIIHETSRHRSLQNVASFTTRATPPPGQRRERDDDPADALATDEEAAEADEEEDEGVIDEEELQAAWSENEYIPKFPLGLGESENLAG